MHSLAIVQWDSTRQDHLGNPGRVSGSGPVMQDTFQTHIRLDHKHGMCLIIMELLFHEDPLSKQWWPHH